ncbi:TraC family protein [Cereibacter sphaeroides]|uniref:TraC family protein n=1 Tax=Cereibacter sphaeroides TaxID=1063 RepID=UPI00202B9F56|nr:TraC family protein [Cereibacter sphaeroides]
MWPRTCRPSSTRNAPNGATIQFLNWTSPDIDGQLVRWARHRLRGDELVMEMAQRRMAQSAGRPLPAPITSSRPCLTIGGSSWPAGSTATPISASKRS